MSVLAPYFEPIELVWNMTARTEMEITIALPSDLYEETKRISVSENRPESKVVVLLAKLGAAGGFCWRRHPSVPCD
jgi:hypothetical protein